MLDFTKLWDKVYLFGPNPLDMSRSDYWFFGLGAVFAAAGIAAKIFAIREAPGSPRKFLWGRLFHAFLTIGILISLWAGARFENIPWLSAHIVALFLVLVWLAWLTFIARYFFRGFRKAQKLWEDEALKRRYLK